MIRERQRSQLAGEAHFLIEGDDEVALLGSAVDDDEVISFPAIWFSSRACRTRPWLVSISGAKEASLDS